MAVRSRSPRAVREAEELLKRLGIVDIPIDPFEIAREHGILVEASPKLQVLGCLMRDGEHFLIGYSTRIRCEGLIRFTVAHELGHYFLPGHPEQLFADGSTFHLSQGGCKSADPYETEADCFAASLLMPSKYFLPALASSRRGFACIEFLAERFNTSLSATAIQYATDSPDTVAVIQSTANIIDYCIMSEAMKRFGGYRRLPRGSMVPEGTETYAFNLDPLNIRSARRANEVTTLDSWFNGASDIQVREDVVGLGGYGKTLTVLYAA